MVKLDGLVPPSPLDAWESEILELIEKGKAKGYLTYEELNTALPEEAPSPEMMDRILHGPRPRRRSRSSTAGTRSSASAGRPGPAASPSR